MPAITQGDPIVRELEKALTDAKIIAPTLPGTAGEQRQTVLDDLDRAGRVAIKHRLAILGALENIRLPLVRVKNRIGTTDATERELAEAARLLESPTL